MLWEFNFIIFSAFLINLIPYTDACASHPQAIELNAAYSDPPGVADIVAVRHGKAVPAKVEERAEELLDRELREDYEILKSPRHRDAGELHTVTKRFLRNYQKKLRANPGKRRGAGKYSGISSQTDIESVKQLTDLQLRAIAIELGFIEISPRSKHNYATIRINVPVL